MFVLRAVYGTHKGEYYSGFDSEKMSPTWSDHQGAERVSGADAAGIVMAMIDGPRIVVVPERLPDTTDEECQSFIDLAAAGRDHILNPFLCAGISRADRDQQWEITDALNSFERNYIANCHSILRDRKRLCEISQHHFHHRFIARLKTEIDIIDPFFEVWIIGKNDSLDCFVDQLRTKRPQCDEDHPQAASRALMNQTCRHWSQLATACRIEVE